MRVRTAYDTRQVSWRHLDLGRIRCLIRCQVRRVECPACGVRNESVPWARSGSRFTRAFEDTCVWLVKAAPKSTVATLMLSRLAHGGPDDQSGSLPSTAHDESAMVWMALSASGPVRSPTARATGT